MKCPVCGGDAQLVSPDYGRGAEFRCYNGRAHRNEYTFASDSAEARSESNSSRSLSRANAGTRRAPAALREDLSSK